MSIDLGNISDYMIIPSWLRKTYLELMDYFDKEWEPWFSRMMPRVKGPGDGALRSWTRDRGADPQGMAKHYGEDDAIEPMNYPHIRPWSYMTRKLGNAFRRNKRVFAEDFKQGVVQKAHAEMMENLTKYINRAIEYMLTRFVYGDTVAMNPFTNQDTNRQGIAHLRAGTFNGVAVAGLGGTSWDDFAAGTPSVFEDLAYLKKRFKRMANKKPVYMMVGRESEYNLELNDDLLDRLIRIEDTTQGVLGDYLMGLQLIKVVGQTYKEIPGADELAIGMPGAGDYLEQDWNRLNKHDMMVENMAGGVYEWSILGTKEIGDIKCGWVDEDHRDQRGSPTEIFIEQFIENRPKQIWTQAQLEYCPYIKDYANIMLIRGIAEQID